MVSMKIIIDGIPGPQNWDTALLNITVNRTLLLLTRLQSIRSSVPLMKKKKGRCKDTYIR